MAKTMTKKKLVSTPTLLSMIIITQMILVLLIGALITKRAEKEKKREKVAGRCREHNEPLFSQK